MSKRSSDPPITTSRVAVALRGIIAEAEARGWDREDYWITEGKAALTEAGWPNLNSMPLPETWFDHEPKK